ncbi:unnamed protein product [Peniophora sp. CBMAI 1063]|nr:unnamed protein product [Peniophora sp. CBMAI 1063]
MDFTSRIPTEILCLVFHFCRRIDGVPTVDLLRRSVDLDSMASDAQREGRDATHLLAWVKVTQVCARWRKVALEDATLWTDVPAVLGGQWMRLFLSRSNQSTLMVDWGIRNTRLREQIDAIILEHHTRMRTFTSDNLKGDSTTFRLLCRTWPALEDLKISIEGNLPPGLTLLDRHAPSLRLLILRMQTISASWFFLDHSVSVFGGLTAFTLEFADGAESESMRLFLHAMASMPHLRHLRFISKSSFEGSSISETRSGCPAGACRRESMPLKTLTVLCADASIVSHMLRHILPSPDVAVIIFTDGPLEDGEEHVSGPLHGTVAQIAEWKAKSFPRFPFSAMALSIKDNDSDTLVSVHISRTPEALESIIAPLNPQWPHELCDYLIFAFPAPQQFRIHHRHAPLYMYILDTLVPSSLRALVLDLGEGSLPPGLHLSRPTFANVTALRLKDFHVNIIKHLARTDEDGRFLLFPALKILDFQDCDLIGSLISCKFLIRDVEIWNALRHMLECRRERHPLGALYLRVGPDEIAKAREEGFQPVGIDDPNDVRLARKVIRQCIDDMEEAPEIKIISPEEHVASDA